MQKILSWIKSHKLTTLLILIIFFLISIPPLIVGGLVIKALSNNIRTSKSFGKAYSSPSNTIDAISNLSFESEGIRNRSIPPPAGGGGTAPQPDVKNRMKIRNARISLHVENVRETVKSIGEYVEKIDGYVVNQRVNTPKESSSGNMQIRVPTEKLDTTLDYLRERSVNVVYEEVSGRDITDEYIDTQAKLDTLNRTKATFEEIHSEAKEFDDILRAQKEILKVQKQIDNVKGQIQYMEGNSQTALITINLSTDALELGYAPSNAWRPGVVLKRAVRSLVKTLRGLGTMGIWIVVYSVIWLPILVAFILIIKLIIRMLKKIFRSF